MRAWALGVAFVVIAACLAALAAPLPAQTPPSMDEVIGRAAKYVADYQTQLSGIVLEEHYRQEIRATTTTSLRNGPTGTRRELRSDVLMVKPTGHERWVQFRDVFEVDRRPVRDRDARLEQLFLKPSSSTMAQAERIARESARYNLGSVERTVNVPVMALIFLDPAFRSRFQFTPVRPGNVRAFAAIVANAGDVLALEYKEAETGTLIRTTADKDLPAHGRFWIDAPTGRVLRTELIAEDLTVRGKIDVTYRLEPGLGFLVPAEMREEYSTRGRSTRILGRATYGKFKRFSVTTEETLKKPGG